MILELILVLYAQETAKALDEAVSKVEGFSGVVLVARKGEIVLEKAYGPADRAGKRENTTATLFDIGSVTKQFTAAAILALEMEKKLSTDDSIAKHLKEVPKEKAAVTIHQLLTHTSGIPNDTGLRGVDVTDRDATVAAYLAPELASKPGAVFRYSNIGYSLLAAIVERASGQSFEAYVKEKIFRPAGMERSGFCQDPAVKEAECAVGFDGKKESGPCVKWFYAWGHRGATGAICTAGELWLWEKALAGGKVLSAEATKKLWTPALENYALGWYVFQSDRGTKVIAHTGSTVGFDAGYYRFVDEETVVIALANHEGKAAAVTPRLRGVLFPRK
jgi:CubicO group peptidase (beta-lactamase class C family)